ncbi:MAG: ABC transporter permease [Candidatus Acidiferrales bacterium]
MKIRDLTELAARNLREAVLRNSLTTLGIAVGVASLVAMLSLGVGLQQFANSRLSSSGLFNAIFVSPHQEDRLDAEQASSTAPKTYPALNETARAQLAKLPNVAEVYPDIRFNTAVMYDGHPYMSWVAGISASQQNGGAFDGMSGKFFSSGNAHETILQIQFAKELSKQPDSLVGKQITIRYAERQMLPAESATSSKAAAGSPPKASSGSSADSDQGFGLSPGFSVVPRQMNLQIVGIVQTDPAGFGGFGRARVLIPEQLAETLSATQFNDLRAILRGQPAARTYDTLTVNVRRASQVEGVEKTIKSMGFSAFSLIDASNNIRLVFGVFDAFLGIFGSLALVVASLGIVNTLVMAILERRREIGVLKALGASDRDVRQLFFAEAGVMGLVGGAFGVLIGWLIGRAISFGTNIWLQSRSLPSIEVSSVPWWMVGGAIAFSIVVSLAAGLYPASRAAHLHPVEALRYE